ncbi:hypothetical protein [Sphingomonas sp. IC081]|uniref:hypothetical protein n=1 Tax=Sphingomonas sp. IC081 TaxID=304378 RepID=UPI001158F519|nr:hypothetical protein [Sphingomonas sp. IC081]QDK35964.1 hypothetical protein DM450_24930 [Sphingomonas sp. IC081]
MAINTLPIFANTDEFSALTTEDGSLASFLMPSIRVTRETLFSALAEVEKLANWIEGRTEQAAEWVRRQRAALSKAQS